MGNLEKRISRLEEKAARQDRQIATLRRDLLRFKDDYAPDVILICEAADRFFERESQESPAS